MNQIAPSSRLRTGLALALVPMLGLLVACKGGETKAAAKPPLPVTVALARLQPAPLEIAAPGTVDAKNSVDVRSRVGGEILQVHFQEGDEVKQGQLLFTIDPRPYRAALAE